MPAVHRPRRPHPCPASQAFPWRRTATSRAASLRCSFPSLHALLPADPPSVQCCPPPVPLLLPASRGAPGCGGPTAAQQPLEPGSVLLGLLLRPAACARAARAWFVLVPDSRVGGICARQGVAGSPDREAPPPLPLLLLALSVFLQALALPHRSLLGEAARGERPRLRGASSRSQGLAPFLLQCAGANGEAVPTVLFRPAWEEKSIGGFSVNMLL